MPTHCPGGDSIQQLILNAERELGLETEYSSVREVCVCVCVCVCVVLKACQHPTQLGSVRPHDVFLFMME